MLSGTYDRTERAPLYLHADLAIPIAPRVGRVRLETASLLDVLRGLPDRSFDAFYLSDVFEMFSREAYEETLVEVTRVGRPGARLCYWNNLVARSRPSHMGDSIMSHERLAACLHARDRAFLYSRFVVESIPGSAQ
jgi:S-adenosylmethionine-diacylglycerol 3-amino-3-carboxypropyl transferase